MCYNDDYLVALGTCDYQAHSPEYDCTMDALYAMQDLTLAGEQGSGVAVASAKRLSTHYLPLFRLQYGRKKPNTNLTLIHAAAQG